MPLPFATGVANTTPVGDRDIYGGEDTHLPAHRSADEYKRPPTVSCSDDCPRLGHGDGDDCDHRFACYAHAWGDLNRRASKYAGSRYGYAARHGTRHRQPTGE